MKRLMLRLMLGLVFAIPLMLVATAWAQAGPIVPAPVKEATLSNCVVCHAEYQDAWAHGAHGQAATNTNFITAWKAQGSPAECMQCHATGYDANTQTWKTEGVTCEACHGPINADHPKTPMPVDRTGKVCGNCHTETYFEWQVSKHRENNIACSSCHDAHATKLKASDPSALCATCHQSMASTFSHTAHADKGLTCADCHLSKLVSKLGEGHGERDHSFNVLLSTCNTCHAYQMHDPSTIHDVTPTPQPIDAMTAVQSDIVSTQPEPVNPTGFAALAGLIGLAFGIVLAPWLEKWYKRVK